MRIASLFSREEPGVAVSAAAHVAMLAAGLVAFASAPQPFADAQESIAVEVVDPSALNEVMRGERSAERAQEAPRPRAERQSEVAEQRNPGEQARDVPTPPTRPPEVKVADDVQAAPPPPPPPPRPAQPPRQQAAATPPPSAAAEPPKPDPRPREAAKPEPAKPELRRDQLAALAEQAELQAQRERAAEEARAAARARAEAEARARQQREAREKAEADARERAESQARARAQAEAEAREKAAEQAAQREKAEAEARARAEAAARQRVAAAEAKAKADAEARARRDAEQAARFNANDISRLLQSREAPQASGSTGREVNRVASLGSPTANAARMNPAMMGEIRDLLQRRIEECYSPPPGVVGRKVVNPFVSVTLAADGTLTGQPRISRAGPTPLDQAIAGAALRAVQRCAPFRIPAKFAPFYAEWKSLSVEFVPPES